MANRLNKHEATTRDFGTKAESFAVAYLKAEGLIELCRNYHTRFGEIDLIMQHDDILVFIEVRYRSKDRYMDPLESIDTRKIRKIILSSQDYLQKNNPSPQYCRFDIITLTGSLNKPAINWIKDAFDAHI